jgi:hypothetical protein
MTYDEMLQDLARGGNDISRCRLTTVKTVAPNAGMTDRELSIMRGTMAAVAQQVQPLLARIKELESTVAALQSLAVAKPPGGELGAARSAISGRPLFSLEVN